MHVWAVPDACPSVGCSTCLECTETRRPYLQSRSRQVLPQCPRFRWRTRGVPVSALAALEAPSLQRRPPRRTVPPRRLPVGRRGTPPGDPERARWRWRGGGRRAHLRRLRLWRWRPPCWSEAAAFPWSREAHRRCERRAGGALGEEQTSVKDPKNAESRRRRLRKKARTLSADDLQMARCTRPLWTA